MKVLSNLPYLDAAPYNPAFCIRYSKYVKCRAEKTAISVSDASKRVALICPGRYRVASSCSDQFSKPRS